MPAVLEAEHLRPSDFSAHEIAVKKTCDLSCNIIQEELDKQYRSTGRESRDAECADHGLAFSQHSSARSQIYNTINLLKSSLAQTHTDCTLVPKCFDLMLPEFGQTATSMKLTLQM